LLLSDKRILHVFVGRLHHIYIMFVKFRASQEIVRLNRQTIDEERSKQPGKRVV